MKLLYFTTASENTEYEKLIGRCRIAPSVASQAFESALLRGFSRIDGLEITARSFPMLASFPGSPFLCWGAKKQKVAGGFPTTWLRTVNLYGAKQFSQKISARGAVKKWLKDNAGEPEKAILLYSVYEPIASQVLKYSKKHGCKAYVIVPDLPRDMYKTLSANKIKAHFQKSYMKKAVSVQDRFDGYIYLTREMADVVAPGKPYVVVEGIADVSETDGLSAAAKVSPRGIMYAGALNRQYGIGNLLDAFLQLNPANAELWLFGAGDMSVEIASLSKSNPAIRYFGRLSREDVLKYEQQATLLVNVRNPDDAFTKYSFPSKTIEYLLSGTPVLTTKLSGIPDEYFRYLYSVTDNSVDSLRDALSGILLKSDETLCEAGQKGCEFIITQKNSAIQAEKVYNNILRWTDMQT